jgi:hypothetical protein
MGEKPEQILTRQNTRNKEQELRQMNQHWTENTKEAIKETHTGG